MVEDRVKNYLKLFGVKLNSHQAAVAGFYTLNGLFVGIGLNDVWRLLNLPGNGEEVVINGLPRGFYLDHVYQVLIGLGLVVAEYGFGLKHGAAFGAGIITGSTFANKSEKGAMQGAYIGAT